MLEQQATRGERIMLLNPRMAKNIAGNLAARQTMNTAQMNAYQRSTLQPIAGFDTFRVDYGKSITGSAGAGYLVSGAQSYTPVSADVNGIPADNRTQTLAVKTGTGAAVGDVFAIAGVYLFSNYQKAISYTPSTNKKALLYALRLGFKKEGVLTQSFLKNGELLDQTLVGLTKGEYLCQLQQ